MPETTVGPNVDEPLDIHIDFTTKAAFHVVVSFNTCADLGDILVGEFLDSGVGVDTGLFYNLASPVRSDTEYIAQSYFDALLFGQINTGYSSQLLLLTITR